MQEIPLRPDLLERLEELAALRRPFRLSFRTEAGTVQAVRARISRLDVQEGWLILDSGTPIRLSDVLSVDEAGGEGMA